MTYSAPAFSDGSRRESAEEDVIEQTTDASPLLRCRDVGVRFGGIVALDGVSFDVPRGSVVGVIGPNGAGKTTLFNCISRIYPIEQGDILIDGRSLRALADHQVAGLGVARTFQNVALFDTMTVTENIMLGAHPHVGPRFLMHALRLPSDARAEAQLAAEVRDLVAMLDLERVAHRRVSELPFATRKRVELGRALASRPRLLLLDEPAAGLNHVEVDELIALIGSVASRFELSVLLVEHHMGLVMRISHRVVALDFGRKIGDGTPAEIQGNPDVVRAYLGSRS